MTISVQNLTKEFYHAKRGKFLALDDVSFSCQAGRIFGLLGLNGAGKTTTLRIIGTLLRARSGTVTIAGFDANTEADQVRRRIGFLPADGGLYDRFTPREILRYFAELSKVPEQEIDQRIDQLITMLNMQSFADTYCKKLSTGMKQKVCVARSIIHDPAVIIFDEPTTSLDLFTSLAMHDFIRNSRDQGKCVLLSTHIMSEAEKLCDDIGILHGGKLLALGTLEELRAKTEKQSLEDIFVKVVQETAI